MQQAISGNFCNILVVDSVGSVFRAGHFLIAGGSFVLQGHRLKSAGGNSTMAALLQLNCPRRLILTGTPVQNNLKECAPPYSCCKALVKRLHSNTGQASCCLHDHA